MPFSREYFTVVEFGTSKLSVAHAMCNEEQNPVVIGFGTRSSENSIVKGDIIDIQKAGKLLAEAFADADHLAKDTPASAASDRGDVYFLFSGPGIRSISGTGNVELFGEDHVITDEIIREAINKAMTVSLPEDRVNVDTLTSYYILDGERRVFNPVGQTASRLEAYVHLVTCDRNRLETMRSLLREIGFEGKREPVFSGIASAYGLLNSDESEQGALLIDVGAGITEYEFVQDDGVLASGIIPVGMDNLANDFSIAFDLPIDQARRIIMDNTIDFLKQENKAFLELPTTRDAVSQISLNRLEDIANKRMLELFSLIRDELNKKNLAACLRGGVVLSGGGAMFAASKGYVSSVFNVPCRIGIPQGITGAVTGLNTPRFSALASAMKYIIAQESTRTDGSLNRLGDLFEEVAGGVFDRLKNLTKVFHKK